MQITECISDYILRTLNSYNYRDDEFDFVVNKVKSILELTQPCRYSYTESGYSYSDHFMANVKVKESVEYYSSDWFIAKQLFEKIDDYEIAKSCILHALIDIKNATILEYDSNFSLVRFAVTYGDTN